MSVPVAARFRAIIAGPLSAANLGVPDPFQATYDASGTSTDQTASAKRKRNPNNPQGAVRKTVRRTSDDEGGSGRERTTPFRDRDELMKAMKEKFEQGPHVDFHGTYDVAEPENNHKAHIQLVANEIWKSTGYRFTVKDHPPFTNGHKTRFWCSQDEAHRSKSSKAARRAQGELYKPRQTSSGEVLAKNRYPCQSRLLVSSRTSATPGRCIITIRMHHHLSHEPYLDLSLPPEIAQGGWGSGWFTRASTAAALTIETTPPPVSAIESMQMTADQQPLQQHTPPQQDTFEDLTNDFQEMSQDMSSPSPQPMVISSPSLPEPPPQTHLPQSSQPHAIEQPSEAYHRRMQAHIRNLREFCDGLEYQLQFNDYQMLHVLERDGGPFLNLVAECLSKEGRLVLTDQPTDAPPVLEAQPPQIVPNAIFSENVSSIPNMQPQTAFDGANHGISPNNLLR